MEWKNLFEEIKTRFIQPWANPTFVGYFVVCILLIGTLGITLSFIEYSSKPHELYKVALSIGSYFIAIISTSFVDLNLSQKIKNRSSFFIYSLLFLLLSIGLLLLLFAYRDNNAFIFASIGCLLSWFIWIIANSDNENLKKSDLLTNVHDNVNKVLSEGW
jgi:hypothetical protein